ncbi:uncharacterized protein B0H18DRAFT_1210256 [Fomitopsis serialis]|uniref:uncharacterized protein n=1 Tax=Fomitopsis serialis TaxID=139415 RepID=UPI002008E0B4|nr:uncharacterized protein B0H18DRAFT_1210256 [Neoantrodia serialis]KAH9928260.1 hypothetical protein B0H18DRAFT_1210256 [Neoantrodia serialis]
MDSEDERDIKQEFADFARCKSYDQPSNWMRLYQDVEARFRQRAYSLFMRNPSRVDASLGADARDVIDSNDEVIRNLPDRVPCMYGDVLRIRRFFDTFIGFHEGVLDLTGRWEKRYSSLYARMLVFLEDIDRLRPHIVTVVTILPSYDGSQIEMTDIEISRPAVEREFRAKYKLSGLFVEELLRKADQVNALLTAGSQPVFQRLLLLQLPVEILCIILQLAGSGGARILTATCKTIWRLAAHYASNVRTLRLRLDLPPQAPYESTITVRITDEASLEAHGGAARGRFMENCALLLSRPDILKRIRTLTIVNEWNEECLELMGLRSGSTRFFRPVRQSIGELLHAATDTSDLQLYSFELSKAIFTAMAKMTRLRTVYLFDCPPRFDFSLVSLPQILSVVNLVFDYIDFTNSKIVMATRVFPTFGPSSFVLTLCGHVIGTDRGPSLRGAPLRVLVLIGLYFVGEELFRMLADATPDISALTLVFSKNARQDWSVSNRWPGTTYQYASYLAALPHLKSFTWNFDLEPMPATLPCDLPLMEERMRRGTSYKEDIAVDQRSWRRQYDGVELWWDEWTCLAKLFAAYVPTLESLTFLAPCGSRIQVKYGICRDLYGIVCIEPQRVETCLDPMDETNPPASCGTEHPWLY